MQIGRFYDLHHGKTFITVSSENDKELWELNTGLPDKEEIFKYEVLSSVKPAEIVDEIIPETIEYQRQLKQLWVDIEVKRTMFFNIIHAHYYWTVLPDN